MCMWIYSIKATLAIRWQEVLKFSKQTFRHLYKMASGKMWETVKQEEDLVLRQPVI